MFGSVFRDMKYFIVFFGFVILFFSLFLIIVLNDISDYNSISYFGFFVITLRQSLGDYVTDSYAKNTDFSILTWFIWLSVMIIGNVIFMNFIIAVVS